jgi:uncharacterized membrane protein YoaK (UPF0700 family)
MSLVDLMHHFVQDVMPIAVPLCVVVGAAFLWRRTRRVSALVQLVASVLLLYGMSVEHFGWRSTGLDRYWSEPMRISMDIAMFLGFALFPVSYLLYALRQRRI